VTEAEGELGEAWCLGQVLEDSLLLGDGEAIAGARERAVEEGALEEVDAAAQEHADERLAGAQPGARVVVAGDDQGEQWAALGDRVAARGVAGGGGEGLGAGLGPGGALALVGRVGGVAGEGRFDAGGEGRALAGVAQGQELGTCLSGHVAEAGEQGLADRAGGEWWAMGAALGGGLQQPGLLGGRGDGAGEGDAGEEVGVVAGEELAVFGEAEGAEGDAEQAECGAAGDDALLAVGVAGGEAAGGVGEEEDLVAADEEAPGLGVGG